MRDTSMPSSKQVYKAQYITIHISPRNLSRKPGKKVEITYTLSLPSVIVVTCDQRHVSAALPPGEIRDPQEKEAGCTHGRSARVRKNSPDRDLIPGPFSL
jgi:hypothetical protein